MRELEGTIHVPQSWARLSPCGLWRYTLGRRWGSGPMMGYVGLNPSTANASVEDRTSGRFRGFAIREGCGSYETVNLDALIETRPKNLIAKSQAGVDVTGVFNDEVIRSLASSAQRVVVCWGGGGHARLARAREVLAILEEAAAELWCFGYTSDGHPLHPLYLPNTKPLLRFERKGELAA